MGVLCATSVFGLSLVWDGGARLLYVCCCFLLLPFLDRLTQKNTRVLGATLFWTSHNNSARFLCVYFYLVEPWIVLTQFLPSTSLFSPGQVSESLIFAYGSLSELCMQGSCLWSHIIMDLKGVLLKSKRIIIINTHTGFLKKRIFYRFFGGFTSCTWIPLISQSLCIHPSPL